MSVISKQRFYHKIPEDISCDVLHYWDENCFRALLKFTPRIFLGTLQFFLPIYIVKALLNYKKLNDKKFIKELIISEIRSGCYGIAMLWCLLGTLCFLRKLFGRMYFYNVGLLSGFMGGLSLLIESKDNRKMDRIIFFNMVVEAFLKNVNHFKIFNLDSKSETIVFMIVSCILMHILANRKSSIDYLHFWFYTPPKVREINCENKNKCSHEKNCPEFLLEGGLKYFALGYLVNVIRIFIPKLSLLSKKPRILLKMLFNSKNISFGLVLGGYVTVFRFLACLLRRNGLIPEKYHSAISGFFSGVTYSVSPNIQLLVIGITTLLQATYQKIINKLELQNKSEIPAQILFMVCSGILFHNRIFCGQTCPPYYINMLNLCTKNRFQEIYKRLLFLIF